MKPLAVATPTAAAAALRAKLPVLPGIATESQRTGPVRPNSGRGGSVVGGGGSSDAIPEIRRHSAKS